VQAGRIVPGLRIEEGGRARSWWWPLPAASDRGLVAALVGDPSPGAQRCAADRLADEVDGLVRGRLVVAGASIVPRRPGRTTVPDAWARALVSPDPWLSPALDPEKVAAMATAVQAWVRSGAVIGGTVRLCLRVHEPATASGRRPPSWRVEVLAQDRDDPSMVVPLRVVGRNLCFRS